MKIVIVSPNFPPDVGGPASLSFELYNRLSPKNKVSVVSFSPYEIEAPKGVVLVSTGGSTLARQWRLFSSVFKLLHDSDACLILEPGTVGLASIMAAKLLRKRTVIKYFGDPVWEDWQRQQMGKRTLTDFLARGNHWKTWRSVLTNFALLLSDKIIVPSEYLSFLLAKHYFLPAKKINILGCPLDVAAAVPSNTNESSFSWKTYLEMLIKVLKK